MTGVSFERSTPRLLEPDTEDNLHRLFEETSWTDHFPIVLPTEERVAEMLTGTSHAPDEIVGRRRPTEYREFWEFDVEKVAVNAVMAGAKPTYLPSSSLSPQGEQQHVTAPPGLSGSMTLVNGPIRHEIGMN